jgi:hypothetical protein
MKTMLALGAAMMLLASSVDTSPAYAASGMAGFRGGSPRGPSPFKKSCAEKPNQKKCRKHKDD